MKVAVCEYLLKVNEDMKGSFIPPTAINWLGDGIVKTILGVLEDGIVSFKKELLNKIEELEHQIFDMGGLNDAWAMEVDKLKEEIERLKNKKCAHQLAKGFGESLN